MRGFFVSNYMQKVLLSFTLIIFLASTSYSQSDYDIKNGLLLRGKVLGGFFVEDYHILTATLGMEYRFTKNFAFGLDFVHINEITEKEYYPNPISDPYYYKEYAQKNPRTCALADIRLYPFQNIFSNSGIHPYLSFFSKYGKIITWTTRGYHFSENEIVKRNGNFYDIGITAGAHLAFNNDRFGLDVNIGYCQRKQIEDTEYFSNTGYNRFESNQVIIKNRLAGRLNLYFYLFSNNK